jgi:class 3 adenylate cyclase/CHASE2 domain-containing sensor protein
MIQGSHNYNVRSCALGLTLTVIVAVFDAAGALGAMERWFYDRRALYFQHFTPPPDSRLVHLDIDDAALETIGRWPWPRKTLADVVDEVRLAGADILALDVIFLEPQPPDVRQVKGEIVTVDHDEALAEAFRKFGRVLVPISFINDLGRRPPHSSVHEAAVGVLRANLELDQRAVTTRLPAGAGPLTEDVYFVARREALGECIEEQLARQRQPADVLRRRLLPGLREDERESSLARQFETQYRQAESLLQTRRFAVARPAACPPLLPGNDPSLLPLFAGVTQFTGFVNDKPSEDGTVRGLPLWVEHHGWLYPQIDLALACAVWGADPRQARLESGRVTIPLPSGREVIIPVRTIGSADGDIGTYYDIPWFGWKNWATMYGPPGADYIDRHIPIAKAWGLSQTRKTITSNIRETDSAMKLFAHDLKLPMAESLLKNSPAAGDFPSWLAGADAVLQDATQNVGPLGEMSPTDDMAPSERDAIVAFHAIRDAAFKCREFIQKSAELKKAMSGKVVLLGSTATGALDQRPTSLHPQCPGVVIHGVLFNTLMTGQFWRFAPTWVTAGITIALGLLVTATVTWLPPWKALAATLLLLAGYGTLNALALFDYGNWVVGLAGPVVVIGVVWGTLTLVRFVIERGERARITRKFRGYVDPQLVEYVIRHPEVSRFEGQVREMTVCFTDLVGFTTMTEKLKEDAVPILGRYINRMVGIMRKHRGFLNRLMGDGIMFSYGAPLENPNHAVDAVITVMEMQAEMTEINRELVEEGLPALAVRGGVSTGRVVVGDSGGTEAVDYTCLGDVTNFGARLESANKYTGTKNLISARTAELLNGEFLLRPVALLQVAGKTQSVMTYEPVARTSEATEEQKRLVAMTQEMMDHYTAGRFENCMATIEEIDTAFGPSKLTKLYGDTCDRYIIERAPDGFHGQIVLTEK